MIHLQADNLPEMSRLVFSGFFFFFKELSSGAALIGALIVKDGNLISIIFFLKAPFSFEIDIYIQERVNKLIYGINMNIKSSI